MSVKITKGNSASPADVSALEEFIGASLPPAFKAFVQEYDGGKPETNTFPIGDDNEAGVNRFIPVHEMLRERDGVENLSARAFPIAWASGGNFVVLDMEADGQIAFWDHEMAEVATLANSFDSFLAALTPFNVDDVELKPGQVKNAWIDPDFLQSLDDK